MSSARCCCQKLGLEILVESEGAIEPTDDYQLISKKPRDPFIGSCLRAVCLNQTALDNLLSLWRTWKRNQSLPYGYSPLRELFSHLKDLRPWGPQDRLKMLDWDEHFAGRITDQPHAIEIELWYRRSPQTRLASQREVTALVEQPGGKVHTSAVIEQIGYHGLKCTVPTNVLLDLARGDFGSVQVVRSANVMYLRVTGQGLPIIGPPIDATPGQDSPVPTTEPVVCLLDGVPAANHPLLRDRVIVHDPDGLLSNATVEELKHGTWMASAAIWCDRGSNEPAASRPVLVRPILTPSNETADRSEELPAMELVPDLMWRVFRELFDGQGAEGPAGPQIAVINVSVGDPASPFDSILSSWARIIDWLSYEYGVLVVVSMGNHPRLRLTPSNSREIADLGGEERRQAVLDAQEREQSNRRPLAPSESVNALAVGALHDDASGTTPQGYALDPADGLVSLSPISATARRSRSQVCPRSCSPSVRRLPSTYRTAPSWRSSSRRRSSPTISPGAAKTMRSESRGIPMMCPRPPTPTTRNSPRTIPERTTAQMRAARRTAGSSSPSARPRDRARCSLAQWRSFSRSLPTTHTCIPVPASRPTVRCCRANRRKRSWCSAIIPMPRQCSGRPVRRSCSQSRVTRQPQGPPSGGSPGALGSQTTGP